MFRGGPPSAAIQSFSGVKLCCLSVTLTRFCTHARGNGARQSVHDVSLVV